MLVRDAIRILCENWLDQATVQGGIAIGGNTERFRLRNNGIEPHSFDQLDCMVASAHLSKILLMSGMNTIIDWDHQHLWAWEAQIIFSRESNFFGDQDRDLKELMSSGVHLALANYKPINCHPSHEALRSNADRLLEHNSKQLLSNSTLLLAYLAFPLLEGLLKKLCSDFISMNGEIIQEFRVRGYGRFDGAYRVGRRCSSLRDLLFLFYYYKSTSIEKSYLDEVCVHINPLGGDEHPFQTIYDWRNQSLHGAASFPTIGGTLLSIVLALSISRIDNYDQVKNSEVEQINRNMHFSRVAGTRDQYDFYPPT